MQKHEAIAACQTCPNKWGKGCDYYAVEGARSDDIDPPSCLKALLTLTNSSVAKEPLSEGSEGTGKIAEAGADHHPAPSDAMNVPKTQVQTRRKPAPPNEQNKAQPHRQAQKINMQQAGAEVAPPKNQNLRPPQYTGLPSWWDELDQKVIALVKSNYHRNGIISRTGKPPSSIRRRLERLIKHGIISPTPQNIGGWACVTYAITPAWASALIHNEGVAPANEAAPLKYDFHATSYRAELLDSNQPHPARPKGDKQIKMNHWVEEIFYYEDHTIRLTPRRAIVDFMQRLHADSNTNLEIKYAFLAQQFLNTFSRKYSIPLGQAECNRNPHRRIPGSEGIASALADKGGELYVPNIGLQVDHSQDEGGELELVGEPGRRSAIILEEAINHFPTLAAGVKSDNLQTRQEVNHLRTTLTETVSKFEQTLESVHSEIKETQGLILLQEQNRTLKAQNDELQNQLKELASQVRALLMQTETSQPQEPKLDKPDKWGYAMYG